MAVKDLDLRFVTTTTTTHNLCAAGGRPLDEGRDSEFLGTGLVGA